MQSNFLSVLMQSIREDIEKEHNAVQNSDVIMFFQVSQFVTSYQYHKLLKSKVRHELQHIPLSTCFHMFELDFFFDNTLARGQTSTKFVFFF